MSSAIEQAKAYSKYNNDLMMSNTRQAQAYNSAEAAKNRDWQERLANSAHQREVSDLKKAGLNPVLSAGGQGATTGSGASASSDAAGVDTSMVGAIIDMASAQLNSATSLQQTAMQTQASIANNIRNNMVDLEKHFTSGGNTLVGQARTAMNVFGRLMGLNVDPVTDDLLGAGVSTKKVMNSDGTASYYYYKDGKRSTSKGNSYKPRGYANSDDLISAIMNGNQKYYDSGKKSSSRNRNANKAVYGIYKFFDNQKINKYRYNSTHKRITQMYKGKKRK